MQSVPRASVAVEDWGEWRSLLGWKDPVNGVLVLCGAIQGGQRGDIWLEKFAAVATLMNGASDAWTWKVLQLITLMRALTRPVTRCFMRLRLRANICPLLLGITASRISGLHSCGSSFLLWEAWSGGIVFSQTTDHLILFFFTFRYTLFFTKPFATFSPLPFVWQNRNVLLCMSGVCIFHNLLCRHLSLETWRYP